MSKKGKVYLLFTAAYQLTAKLNSLKKQTLFLMSRGQKSWSSLAGYFLLRGFHKAMARTAAISRPKWEGLHFSGHLVAVGSLQSLLAAGQRPQFFDTQASPVLFYCKF